MITSPAHKPFLSYVQLIKICHGKVAAIFLFFIAAFMAICEQKFLGIIRFKKAY